MKKISTRSIGLDVIRCIALLCVIGVHFLLYTGIYQTVIAGPQALIMVMLQTGFMVSVPLFLMLSGYLQSDKQPTKSYYIGLVRILFIYLLASLCCGAFAMLVLRNGTDLFSVISGIFSYTTAPYAWYVEMYIGLYLLIPFLNILYKALPSQKHKKLLLATLLVLTVAPTVFNIFRFDSLKWWLMPSSATSYHQLVPQWWTALYPITFYYLGCYLKEYPLRIKAGVKLLLLAVNFILFGCFNYYRSYNAYFIAGTWQTWNSAQVTVQAVLLFSLFEQARYNRSNKVVAAILAAISKHSLGTFLISWIFDQLVYKKLYTAIPHAPDRLVWILVAVPIILTASVLASSLLSLLYSITAGRLVKKLQSKKTQPSA